MGQVLFHRHIAPGKAATHQNLQIFQKLANEDLQHGEPPQFLNAAFGQLRRPAQAPIAAQHLQEVRLCFPMVRVASVAEIDLGQNLDHRLSPRGEDANVVVGS